MALTGTPTAPTAPFGTNTNQIATTAFVQASAAAGAGTSSGTGTTVLAAGTDASNALVTLPGMPPRTLAARAADVYNVRDFGALGTNSSVTIGASFPSSVTASLAAFASQNVRGTMPYAWMTNPAFGLTFTIPTSVDQGGSGTTLTFLESLSGINGWSATVAVWQDPAYGNYLLQPGMQVSGSCIAAGTTVSAVGRTPGATGYGTVTLSKASSADCGSGAAISFATTPSQLQALTVDWLGIQSAMAASCMNTQSGGSVYMPSGNYIIDRSLVNAGGISNTAKPFFTLDLRGDGLAATTLTAPADLGRDMCVITEGARGPDNTSVSRYHDFSLFGPGFSRKNGVSPSQMDGLCIGETAAASDVDIEAMHAGLNGIRDHWSLRNVRLKNNGYGIYFAPYTTALGNQYVTNSDLTGNTIASVAVSSTNSIDSATFINDHTGFSPYGFYEETAPQTVSGPIGFLTNSLLQNVWIEGVGNAWLYAATAFGNVIANTFIGGGASGVGSYTSYTLAGAPIPAVVYVPTFKQNTLIGTNWSSYGNVSDAIIEASSDCSGNTWLDDPGFFQAATLTVPPLKCPSVVDDTFSSYRGKGAFFTTRVVVPSSGMALADVGGNAVTSFSEGMPFAGLSASPASANAAVAVLQSSALIENVPKAFAAQNIVAGQFIFPTNGGFAGGIDSDGAIGTASWYFTPGTSTMQIRLDPTVHASPRSASTGLTAAGTSQVTAFAINSGISEFANVAAGTGATLPITPISSPVIIYNDGASPLTIYPPSGQQIVGKSANAGVFVPSGTSATFRRISPTLWHQ